MVSSQGFKFFPFKFSFSRTNHLNSHFSSLNINQSFDFLPFFLNFHQKFHFSNNFLQQNFFFQFFSSSKLEKLSALFHKIPQLFTPTAKTQLIELFFFSVDPYCLVSVSAKTKIYFQHGNGKIWSEKDGKYEACARLNVKGKPNNNRSMTARKYIGEC